MVYNDTDGGWPESLMQVGIDTYAYY